MFPLFNALIISFIDEDIRNIFENENIALERYSSVICDRLKTRFSDLEACEFLNEISMNKLKKTQDLTPTYQYEIIKDKVYLLFEIIPIKLIDLSKISRIKITKIIQL